MKRLANLWATSFTGKGHLYVEYGNEDWNALFPQYQYTYDLAQKDPRFAAESNPWGKQADYIAVKSMEVGQVFTNAFKGRADGGKAADGKTAVRVELGTQAAQLFWDNTGLKYVSDHYGAPKNFFYGEAIAPYSGIEEAVDKPGLTLEQYFANLNLVPGKYFPQTVGDHKKLADGYGLHLDAYEGGFHITDFNNSLGAEVNGDLKLAASRDPRNLAAMKALFSQWQAINPDGAYNWFNQTNEASKYGYWGLLESADQHGSAKWDAMMSLLVPAGDATLDGKVDYADFLTLKDHWGQPGSWWEDGHFSTPGSPGTVGLDDFNLLRANLTGLTADQLAQVNAFGRSIGLGGISATPSPTFPEPTGLAAVVLAVAALARRRARPLARRGR